MNLLLRIGCDKYSSLNELHGAEADARSIFEIMTGKSGIYDPTHSQLLLSPTLKEVTDSIKALFASSNGADVVTFFFAGHGGVKAGTFYFCTRDSELARLSTTALPITHLFTVIGDYCPPQVNIIVDACEAGGTSINLGKLIQPDIAGASTSSSIAFLGACGSDQYAGESDGHGFLTSELIRCLGGEIEVQRLRPFLDLVEVGAVVSPLVRAQNPDQRPISWGLSLFGGMTFASNPLHDIGAQKGYFPLPRISAFSPQGEKIRAHSAELWEAHREMPEVFSPRRLLNIFKRIAPDNGDASEMLSLIDGLSNTLSVRAKDSQDSLAPSLCLATCLISLLPQIDNADVQSFVRTNLKRLLQQDLEIQKSLLHSIRSEENFLLSPDAVAGDLYYLPLRVTKLLGWLGSQIIIQELFPELKSADTTTHDLASELLARYAQSIVTVSEAQAAPIHAFMYACKLRGWDALASDVLAKFYVSFCERKGNVTRVDTQPPQAVRYILSHAENNLKLDDWKPATPSNLFPVLLLWGKALGLSQNWSLRQLDRLFINFFLANDHRAFGDDTIDYGMNHLRQIGFGLWTVDEFIAEYNQALEQAGPTFELPPEGVALCVLSALLFPDRVPFLLQPWFDARSGISKAH